MSAILVLGTVALFFIVRRPARRRSSSFFGDILLTFFLAWLLAFIISPLVTRIIAAIPRAAAGPRHGHRLHAVVVAILVVIIVLVVGRRSPTSIAEFVASIPQIQRDLPAILAPWQAWLDSLGLGQVDLVAQAQRRSSTTSTSSPRCWSTPLQQIAVASISVVGTMLIVFFLSIYMVVDRDQILAFLFRLVPPAYAEEARLLQTSVARSFGGFLRGQALMGVVYFVDRPRHQRRPRPAAGRADLGRRRAAHGDPVLRPVRRRGRRR